MKFILTLVAVVFATASFAQGIKKENIVRPAGTKPATAPAAELLKRGKALYSDTKLSRNKTSCMTCHTGFKQYKATFKQPYPHAVKMTTQMLKLDKITAETMVQFCLMAPMQAPPLAWNSVDLAALTAYTKQVRSEFAKIK